MNSTTPEIADIEARLREIERVAAELARLPGLYLVSVVPWPLAED
ncbi:hypothetical protein ACC689_20255 [Rhizobium ruizarguesonis]